MNWGVTRRVLALGLALPLLGAGLLVLEGGAVRAEETKDGRLPDEDPALEKSALKEHRKKVKAVVDSLRKEKNQELVRHRIEALGDEPTRVARDALIDYATGNKNHEFVGVAFRALSTMGSRKTLDFLCGKQALRSKKFLVQLAAAEALASVGDERASEVLLDVMTGTRTKIMVVAACARAVALCARDDALSAQVLFKYSSHKKDTIRAAVVEALGYLKTEDALLRLVEVIQGDKNTRVRESAARGLGHLGDPAAIPVLERALREEKAFTVKEACVAALRTLRRAG